MHGGSRICPEVEEAQEEVHRVVALVPIPIPLPEAVQAIRFHRGHLHREAVLPVPEALPLPQRPELIAIHPLHGKTGHSVRIAGQSSRFLSLQDYRKAFHRGSTVQLLRN